MKKLILLFLFALCCQMTAQPILYGLTSRGLSGSGTISKYEASTNTLSSVYNFSNDGRAPWNNLVQATNGKIYGITSFGGNNDRGVIYSFDPSTSIFNKVKDIGYIGDVEGGFLATGGLIQGNDGKLYGMTQGGGSNNMGVIYSLEPNTSIYTKVKDFDNSSGYPTGRLVQADDGKLYGMTSNGGINNFGVVFSFDPSTTIFTKLKDLQFSDGVSLAGSLIKANDGKLYGITVSGGANNSGAIFSLDPSTSVFTKLKDLDISNGPASGSLIQFTDNKLYGMTSGGGLNNSGVIFSFEITTATYTKLLDFNNVNGRTPAADLIKANDGKLYGVTRNGGAYDIGVIFSFNPYTSDFAKLKDFNGSLGIGLWPNGSLFQATDGKLYGTSSQGGVANGGILFSFDLVSATTTKLKDFTNENGKLPIGGLIKSDDGKLYGMTGSGGNKDAGVIFSFDSSTSTFTKVKDFDLTDGRNPQESLVKGTDGKLYGMTFYGGNSGNGVIFSFDPSTLAYNKLKDFDGINGKYPKGRLLQANDGKLYGTTSIGGINNSGVIFSFDPVTFIFVKLKDFDGTNGNSPTGSLVQVNNGKIYGTTLSGGSSNSGVIFSYDPINNLLVKLLDGIDGAGPAGLILANDGKLYGTTSSYSIFSYDPITSIFSKLNVFNYSNGQSPTGLVQASDGKLYGMTSDGGGGNTSSGVIFSLDPGNSNFTKLKDFDVFNGSKPSGDLIDIGETVLNINTTALSLNTLCPGSYFTINYSAIGLFNAGNVFTAQLSDALGGFTSPVNIGALNRIGSGKINVTIPENTPAGTAYRIRVVSNNPIITGGDNGNNISVGNFGTLTTYYKDGDGDGFGDALTSVRLCSIPTGYVLNNTDCDDNNVNIHPGVLEICGNRIDDNCDGRIDEGCLYINDVTVNEGGIASVSVFLLSPSALPIKFNYTTKDGTAISKGKTKDFTTKNGTLTIPAGSMSANITISVASDNILESTEYFDLVLSKVTNATLFDSSGRVFIANGTALSKQINPEFSANIYPNPSEDQFTLEISGYDTVNEKVEITVYNFNGIEVYNANGVKNIYVFGENFPSGMYIVDVRRGNENTVLKVIKN